MKLVKDSSVSCSTVEKNNRGFECPLPFLVSLMEFRQKYRSDLLAFYHRIWKNLQSLSSYVSNWNDSNLGKCKYIELQICMIVCHNYLIAKWQWPLFLQKCRQHLSFENISMLKWKLRPSNSLLSKRHSRNKCVYRYYLHTLTYKAIWIQAGELAINIPVLHTSKIKKRWWVIILMGNQHSVIEVLMYKCLNGLWKTNIGFCWNESTSHDFQTINDSSIHGFINRAGIYRLKVFRILL